METIVVASGCFWCGEPLFKSVRGVQSVESGYIGGHVDNPTYKQVCGGDTGHAEGLRITYDPSEISHDELLDIFFETHDPTQLNRQGNDVGTQYRSAIFYESDTEKALAMAAIQRAQSAWPQPIVTTLEPMSKFYAAEEYHQDYFAREGNNNSYCTYVVAPKLQKFRKTHAAVLKA